MLRLRERIPNYPSGCPPNVEYLKILGTDFGDSTWLPLDDFYDWLSTIKKLRELRMVQRGDWYPVKGPRKHNWNTILPMFKDSLEVFVLDGNRYNEGSYFYGSRFGEAGRLDCLPKMKRLKYLKAPLHYLRDDTPKDEEELQNFDWDNAELPVEQGVDAEFDALLGVDEQAGDDQDDEQGNNEQGDNEQQANEQDNMPPDWKYNRMKSIRLLNPGEKDNIRNLI